VGGVVVVVQTVYAHLMGEVFLVEVNAVSARGKSEVAEEGTGSSGAGHRRDYYWRGK